MTLRPPFVPLFVLLTVLVTAAPHAEPRKPKPVPLEPIAPLDLPRTLDLYESGHFEAAVRAVASAGDETGRKLRRHWAVTGAAWIDAVPERRPHRLLAAAALALETEGLRAERGDWRVSGNPPCAAACVLDWAHLQLLARGEPDAAEHAWYMAAAALGSGVRDWRYLQRTVDAARTPRLLPGLMDRALIRFPDDPEIRLERGIAAAGRFTILNEDGRIPGVRRAATVGLLTPGWVGDLPSTPAAEMLSSLASDPRVGAEARMRLGFLYWAAGNDAASRAELEAAAQAPVPEVRYLAHFLLGWTAALQRDNATATGALEGALATRPRSQSASVLLAALELQRGDADRADEIARASLQDGRSDADPWRLFLYAHHRRLPDALAALRREVAR